MSVSETEAVLVFKMGWPDHHTDLDNAPEICRIFVPKNLLMAMMKDWPKKLEEIEKKTKQAHVTGVTTYEGSESD